MITSWSLFLMSTMLLFSTLMLIQTHISTLINTLILQNILLALYLLTKAILTPDLALLISSSITIFVKVLVLPFLLWKLTRFLQLSGRIEPIVNKPTVLILAIILILFALMLGYKTALAVNSNALASFALGIANAFVATLLITVRRKTISQVIGLLVLENSIFLLAAALSTGFPWLIELGMSFDVLMGFMIFTLFLMRIRQMHGSLQTHHLEHLKERI